MENNINIVCNDHLFFSPDGTELTLQNNGQASCSVPYHTGFVTMGGGYGSYHGEGGQVFKS